MNSIASVLIIRRSKKNNPWLLWALSWGITIYSPPFKNFQQTGKVHPFCMVEWGFLQFPLIPAAGKEREQTLGNLNFKNFLFSLGSQMLYAISRTLEKRYSKSLFSGYTSMTVNTTFAFQGWDVIKVTQNQPKSQKRKWQGPQCLKRKGDKVKHTIYERLRNTMSANFQLN